MSRTPEDIHAQWRESAGYWEKHRVTIHQMLSPITERLIDVAGITRGMRVLDVAAGTGEPSLTIAEIVGGEGQVVCTDLAGEMVAAAEREARRLGLVNIEFCQAAAQALPFGYERFDAAVSRLGAMFFPEAVAALRQMLSVIRRGGRVALAVWRGPEFNPFFRVVSEVMSRYIVSPPEELDTPGAFRFAEPGKLADLLRRAGAIAVEERLLEFELLAALVVEDFWTLRREMSDTLREKAALLSPEQLARVASEVTVAARPFFAGGRMRFPAQVLIVSGAKQ